MPPIFLRAILTAHTGLPSITGFQYFVYHNIAAVPGPYPLAL